MQRDVTQRAVMQWDGTVRNDNETVGRGMWGEVCVYVWYDMVWTVLWYVKVWYVRMHAVYVCTSVM